MLLIPMLLSAITFAPMASHAGTVTPTEGLLRAQSLAKSTCAPGDICASTTFNRNGCFFNNYYNGTVGGTPLAIDVTQTGPQGSNTYIYWVNNTNKNIVIKSAAYVKFYCL
ncbi:MAG: hypothetical protein JO078_11865 [Candidatus Eremiobacteraeota bacterium]|nr:hypothetical protein [Candidatus Eremiobacteraeota bacterium]